VSPLVEAPRLYSIGMASRLSGVPIETIRTWERRYSVLTPTRTAGGHRKYTRENVETLKRLRAMTERGHRIGDLSPDALDVDLAPPALAASTSELPRDDGWVAAVIAAAKGLNADDVERELTKPWQSGDTRHATRRMLDVLRRAGDLWHEGQLEVSAEHLIERAVTKRLFATLSLLPRPRGRREAILACPPGELHEVALLASALLLYEHDVAATYLGANLPVDDLARAIESRHPAMVILGVTTPLAPDDRDGLVEVLSHAIRHGTRVLLGGPSAPDLARLVKSAELVPSIDDLARALG
jgi:DNA-binding transcriptional MerR regulator